jgi:hypothetical protein
VADRRGHAANRRGHVVDGAGASVMLRGAMHRVGEKTDGMEAIWDGMESSGQRFSLALDYRFAA